MKEFDQILEECEDPGEASTTSTAAQVHIFLLREQLLPQTTLTITGESTGIGFLTLLPLPESSSVPLAQV